MAADSKLETKGIRARVARQCGWPGVLGGLAALIASCAVLSACAVPAPGTAAGDPRASGPVSGQAVAGSGSQPASVPVPAADSPRVAAAPHTATMPGSTPGSPGASASSTAAPHATGSSPSATGAGGTGSGGTGSGGTGSGGTGSPGGQPAGPAPGTCTHPKYQTSGQLDMWNQDPYFVYNNMWNVSGYSVTQTLYACSYGNWYVAANMNNDKGDGAVKTYPNSHRDFHDTPKISSLSSLTSTFAESSPSSGIWENAYDIWINRVSNDHPTELMVWTHNHGQSPGGTHQGSATFGGRGYQVWRGVNGNFTYVALVADQNFTSGTLDLLSMAKWLIQKGWMPGNSTLDQVCYGPEIVSTGGARETFSYSGFSVSAS
jgi:hypothetical protein